MEHTTFSIDIPLTAEIIKIKITKSFKMKEKKEKQAKGGDFFRNSINDSPLNDLCIIY